MIAGCPHLFFIISTRNLRRGGTTENKAGGCLYADGVPESCIDERLQGHGAAFDNKRLLAVIIKVTEHLVDGTETVPVVLMTGKETGGKFRILRKNNPHRVFSAPLTDIQPGIVAIDRRTPSEYRVVLSAKLVGEHKGERCGEDRRTEIVI